MLVDFRQRQTVAESAFRCTQGVKSPEERFETWSKGCVWFAVVGKVGSNVEEALFDLLRLPSVSEDAIVCHFNAFDFLVLLLLDSMI